jgi:hypothetical protein
MTLAEIQNPSNTKDLYVPAALFFGSLFFIILILFRFDWLQQFSICRALARWGKGSWSFPASRYGAISGFLVFLVFGAFVLDSNTFRFVKKEVWIAAYILVGIYIPSAAIHDFILHKRTHSRASRRHPNARPSNQNLPRPGSTAIIEPFGSTISAISKTGPDVEILFTPAWARISRDQGPDWYQDARLILKNTSLSGPIPNLPFEPTTSELTILDDERHVNELPVPLTAVGLIKLTLDLDDDRSLTFKADLIDLEFVGERAKIDSALKAPLANVSPRRNEAS